MTRPARQRAEIRGRRAEWLAALFLRLKGYRILAERHRNRAGEIDIIARRGGTIAFVEVKARDDLAAALEAVTPSARRRISRAAQLWLASHPELAHIPLRYDIVVLQPGRLPLHRRDAWRIEDIATRGEYW